MSVTVELIATTDLTDTQVSALRAMKTAVYPHPPASYPETQREWDRPRWGVFVTVADELVSYTGVFLREGAVDGSPTRIGGVGGVATDPSQRGKGYAPLGMARALDFLLARQAAFALLVCRDALVGYYERLGWRPFAGTLLNTQFGRPEVFTFNRVMVGDLAAVAPMKGTIDLLGPAW